MPESPCSDSPPVHTLRWVSQNIVETLKTRPPVKVDGVPQLLHWLPPHIPKKGSSELLASWENVESLVTVREKKVPNNIDGSKWFSLRLDGVGFSKLLKKFKADGVLDNGFSLDFAEAMQVVCQTLMKTFHAKVGYTQSDEITVVVEPAPTDKNGKQHQHDYNGAVGKLCSIASSSATGCFIGKMVDLCYKKGLKPTKDVFGTKFDCRVGWYDSWEEARAILLWRAYNCHISGVSDAVHQFNLPDSLDIMKKNTAEKLKWLNENKKLPLPPHQQHGSYYVSAKRIKQGTNLLTGQPVTTWRPAIENIDGSILFLAREDMLLCSDDVQPSEVSIVSGSSDISLEKTSVASY